MKRTDTGTLLNDADILEIALVFYFLTSLDKVFRDVHLCTIPYKKTRKNCEGISIKQNYYYGSIKTKCRY